MAALHAAAAQAAARHAQRHPARAARCMKHALRYDRCLGSLVMATRALTDNDPMRQRAVIAADRAAWMAAAYRALARGDAADAWAHLKQARRFPKETAR